jgi:hypothetical protein
MNLNLFFSNSYPVPRNAMISSVHEVVGGGLGKNSLEITLNPCKKKRIDESAGVMQIGKRTRKAHLTIISEDSNGYHNEILQQDGEDRTFKIPLSLSQNVQRATVVYEGKNDYDSDDTNGVTGEHTKSSNRTDLSNNAIGNTLDGWEDTASESESLD